MKAISFILSLFISASCFAETSLWRVSKNGNHLYLGGTVHVLSASDLPFPVAFDRAYDLSDKVVLETDMAALADPQIQVSLMSQLSYSDGRLLNQIISPVLYADLNRYLQDRHMMPNMFIAMKPSGVMITMLAVEMQRLGINEAGADTVYYERAVKEGKSVAGLEAIDRHLKFIADMGEGNEESFLRQTLEDIKKTEIMMKDIVHLWKTGDVRGLERVVITDIQLNYPQMYQLLLVERNRRWLPQIKTMLETEPVELVLVGAAHLIGPDGILVSLEQQGYLVEQQ